MLRYGMGTTGIEHRYGRGTPWMWILHINVEVLDMILKDTLPILKHLGIRGFLLLN